MVSLGLTGRSTRFFRSNSDFFTRKNRRHVHVNKEHLFSSGMEQRPAGEASRRISTRRLSPPATAINGPLTALLAHGDEGADLVILFFNRQRHRFLRELRASYAHCSEPKSFRGSFLRICLLFFAPPAFVSCPALYFPFPAVKLQLFLNAIRLQMFAHRSG
jgi:hypothetical protein